MMATRDGTSYLQPQKRIHFMVTMVTGESRCSLPHFFAFYKKMGLLYQCKIIHHDLLGWLNIRVMTGPKIGLIGFLAYHGMETFPSNGILDAI